MLVYVAGKWEEKERVRAVQAEVESCGWGVSHDWTNGDASRIPEEAEADLDGVDGCDAFLLLWHPNLRGGLAELGAALALGKAVVVVGAPADCEGTCIFYQHPRVIRVQDLNDAFLVLDGVAAATGR